MSIKSFVDIPLISTFIHQILYSPSSTNRHHSSSSLQANNCLFCSKTKFLCHQLQFSVCVLLYTAKWIFIPLIGYLSPPPPQHYNFECKQKISSYFIELFFITEISKLFEYEIRVHLWYRKGNVGFSFRCISKVTNFLMIASFILIFGVHS